MNWKNGRAFKKMFIKKPKYVPDFQNWFPKFKNVRQFKKCWPIERNVHEFQKMFQVPKMFANL